MSGRHNCSSRPLDATCYADPTVSNGFADSTVLGHDCCIPRVPLAFHDLRPDRLASTPPLFLHKTTKVQKS